VPRASAIRYGENRVGTARVLLSFLLRESTDYRLFFCRSTGGKNDDGFRRATLQAWSKVIDKALAFPSPPP
jgi:hypothetical protein